HVHGDRAVRGRHDVAVRPRRERGLVGTGHGRIGVVDGHVPALTATVGDVVGSVVPPVRHLGAGDDVVEPDHALDLGPALGAGEHVAVGVVDRGVGGSGHARVGVGDLVARVDSGRPVRPGQHDRVGQHVLGAPLVVHRLAVALGVVVVDEDTGTVGGQLASAD